VLGRFRGPETAALHFFIIVDCPSHAAVHRRRSGLSCCRYPYLEQSTSTRHVRTLYVCFPRTLEGLSLQAFLSLTRYRNFCSACAVTVVIFVHFNRSFYLLTCVAAQLYARIYIVIEYADLFAGTYAHYRYVRLRVVYVPLYRSACSITTYTRVDVQLRRCTCVRTYIYVRTCVYIRSMSATLSPEPRPN